MPVVDHLASTPASHRSDDTVSAFSRSSNDSTIGSSRWDRGKEQEQMRRRSSVDFHQTADSRRNEKDDAGGTKEEGDGRRGKDDEEEEKTIVSWEENDPENPRNWSNTRKWTIIASLLCADFAVSLTSTGYTPAAKKFAKDMGVSPVVAVLPQSMTLLGYGTAPLLLAPLSKYMGRRPVYIAGHILMLIWNIASAVAPNLGGFLVLRFLAGFFGSMTVSNVGGSIADMWAPTETASATSAFVATAVSGPGLAYMAMSFVAQWRPWRDVMWAICGITGGMLIILITCQRETRHSILLEKRCRRLRKVTGNDKLDVPKEMRRKGLMDLFMNHLVRPFKMQFTEPMCMAASLVYISFYGVNYLFTSAFPLVFGNNGSRSWKTWQIGLVWLGMVIGAVSGAFTHILQERKFRKGTKQNGGVLVPERRLHMACIAGIDALLTLSLYSLTRFRNTYPASLFWFAWTTYPSVLWVAPVLSTVLFGWAFFTLILMVNQGLTDAYGEYAASALAATGLARNLAAAGFPLFGTGMYNRLGLQWASSLLAFLALLITPIPFLFKRYGKMLRMKSPYARQRMEELGEDTGKAGSEGEV